MLRDYIQFQILEKNYSESLTKPKFNQIYENVFNSEINNQSDLSSKKNFQSKSFGQKQ